MAAAKQKFIKLEVTREKKHYKAYRKGLDTYEHADRKFPVIRLGDTLSDQLKRNNEI